MRLREKLTVEEKVSLALELIKRERSLEEISEHYRVSHTTAYKIRNQFLEGGRRALGGGSDSDLEARVRALEVLVARDHELEQGDGRAKRGG
jgi:transposase-like protein